MPKHKNKQQQSFIDKKKACVFKLISRDPSDPNYNEKTKNDNIWQLVSHPDEDYLNQQERSKVNFVMNQFSDKEQGIFKQPKKVKEFNEEFKPEIPSASNLWINNPEFIKMKQEQQRQKYGDDQCEYIEEYDVEEVEELEQIEESEEEDQNNSDEFQADNQLKNEYEKLDDYQKAILKSNKVVDVKSYKVQNAKVAQIDEYGLPTNTYYNYQQHIADEITEKGGEVIYIQGQELHYVENNDYEYDQMTQEQKEVFDALKDYEHEDEYEQFDDNFFNKLKDGDEDFIDQENKDKIIQQIQKKPKQIIQKKPQDDLNNIDKVIQEFDQCDNEQQQLNNQISNQDFNNILDNHIKNIQEEQAPQLIQGTAQKNKKVTFIGDDDEEYEDIEFNEEELEEIRKQEEEELRKEEEESKDKTLADYAFLKYRQKKKPKHTSKHKGDKDVLDEALQKDSELNQKYGKIIPFAQDKHMQRVLEQDSADDGELPEQPEVKEKSGTIATKDFNKSQVSENLTIITEVSSKKKKNKQVIHKQQPEEIKEDCEEEEEENQVCDIYVKRDKNETPEEKKKRKAQIKEFKKQQKERKKEFKEQLNKQKQHQQNKINKQTNQQQMTGVSVMKVS